MENNLKNNIAFCEAQGLAYCFQAYADNSAFEEIMMIGFNENSGYTYIALENGIQIASLMGQRVEYIITGNKVNEEYHFDNYKRAERYMNLSLTDED